MSPDMPASLPQSVVVPPVDLDAACSAHFTWRQLLECGDTWHRLATAGTPCVNVPVQRETWHNLQRIAVDVLDPLVAKFGALELTSAFAGPALTRHISRRIAPRLDQHAGAELRSNGTPICPRGGQAVDFQVPGMPSSAVARFILAALPYDRLYFYGDDRPMHVSVSDAPARASFQLTRTLGGHLIPKPWPR